ncbi:dTDP-4-dehydrorhamnose 3,5-epimerase [Flexivirga sp. ID2601S]|uniref:dTDP-4-dehydrorhamnose 3,5-epimerase n=1 Tax=Flexivirga aerilata TaxID=1656889 RepID=A0A849AH69_9MICO|nr:dTDP-4-dehydrorhamnose 3,5-epimerase [Flexivirga aerilata]NNG38548.1 dTDP-4-dehydrorhamnose 3,5-epimerase [Flexivirga aerilata]
MDIEQAPIPGVLVFRPQPHRDDRGFFTRTFDADIAAAHGLDATGFVQDSQSRSSRGAVRGLHGRAGRGESKLVRCAHGAVLDVLVDVRPGSETFGTVLTVRLDDVDFAHVYVPAGLLHGFQVLSETADVCYRIDRPHDPSEDLGVRYDDPELAIDWPLPVAQLSERDRAAMSFADLRSQLGV